MALPLRPSVAAFDVWDPIHAPGAGDLYWTTDNAGEAVAFYLR
jgi:hypothetical protein